MKTTLFSAMLLLVLIGIFSDEKSAKSIGDEFAPLSSSSPMLGISKLDMQKVIFNATFELGERRAHTNDEMRAILSYCGWRGRELEEALDVAMCESSNEAWVSDPVTATHHSLFQIGEKWMPFLGLTDVNDLFNPLVNACGALKIYEKEGWGPWLDSIDCHGYQ